MAVDYVFSSSSSFQFSLTSWILWTQRDMGWWVWVHCCDTVYVYMIHNKWNIIMGFMFLKIKWEPSNTSETWVGEFILWTQWHRVIQSTLWHSFIQQLILSSHGSREVRWKWKHKCKYRCKYKYIYTNVLFTAVKSWLIGRSDGNRKGIR